VWLLSQTQKEVGEKRESCQGRALRILLVLQHQMGDDSMSEA